MRFHLRIDISIDVASVADAQSASSRVQQAAVAALGPSATVDADGRVRCDARLTPADDAAGAGLEAEDLGPGLSSRLSGPPSES